MKDKKNRFLFILLLVGTAPMLSWHSPQKPFADPNLQNPHIINESRPAFPSYEETIASPDGPVYIVNNPDSLLVLVNKERRLPDFYIPEDLRIPKVRFSFDGDQEKMKMRKEAAGAMENLFKAAEKQNIHLFVVSAFRSYERQKVLNSMYKRTEGEAAAAASSAVPGTSEHQTGLAADVSSASINFQIHERFAETKEGKWLAAHAHEYGFVVRYPKYKSEVTGYTYEPWHIRYVGQAPAAYLYGHHLTLEEVMPKK
ncbi:M15 family metallopeptidase [Ectobacillus ponti]|uniref:M15 family metallopeptidase n=1 Tax=Ectobacillus ponti TaxID=2961894 RepID=UPI0027BB13A3|nr:M15 family metallopeptidase [Ectobacillus ponti]